MLPVYCDVLQCNWHMTEVCCLRPGCRQAYATTLLAPVQGICIEVHACCTCLQAIPTSTLAGWLDDVWTMVTSCHTALEYKYMHCACFA